MVGDALRGLPEGAGPSPHLLRLSGVTSERIVIPGTELAADRTYTARGIPPGRYQLTIYAPSIPRVACWFEIGDRDVEAGDIDFSGALAPGDRTFEVVVDTDDGARGGGPEIVYRREDWPANVWRRSGSFFNEVFRVDDVTPGTYEIRITTQRGDPEVWDLTATANVKVPAEGDPPRVHLRVTRR